MPWNILGNLFRGFSASSSGHATGPTAKIRCHHPSGIVRFRVQIGGLFGHV